MSEEKQLTISAIKEGTVIDHIPSESTIKVVEILDLEKTEKIVSIATNLKSETLGKKGIVKIGGVELTEEDANKIAIIAPNATLNKIKDYKVSEKTKLHIPDHLTNILKCYNPKCITNHEDMQTKFSVLNKKPLKVKCRYCEKCMKRKDIVLK